jgi:NAD(P) transhydrogenase subunit beta
MAVRVPMTSMPEMVAALNGFGGGASVLVAWAEVGRYLEARGEGFGGAAFARHGLEPLDATLIVAVMLSVLIGAVTFSGSFVAFGKLNGRISGAPLKFPGMRVLTALLFVAGIAATAYPLAMLRDSAFDPGPLSVALPVLVVASLLLGILVVIPIGGADMPVVVSLLNSYSGLAAAMTGFVLENYALIVSGALVGASGIILSKIMCDAMNRSLLNSYSGIAAAMTGFVLENYALIVSGALVGASGIILSKIMCDAMNRSLLNVLLGGFGTGGGAEVALVGETRTVRSVGSDDAAVLLAYAGQVVVVPGYGLAVAQAQHVVRELADLLQARGVEVKYAIHPVAGRMPGHMNVLLAEANVPYDQLYEMDDINADFERTDVALVIGANDIVNPAARHDAASPIYGMPILNVDKARNVIVMKRSMAAGYAGVDNELFYLPNNAMLFGDAKKTLQALVASVKEV